MGKKNNPGCNCCGRVLVWDMGVPGLTSEGNPTHTVFQDFSDLQAWSEDEDGVVKIEVDFATGSAHPSSGFWGIMGESTGDPSLPNCPASWENETRFDPETDGVDLGYWTGDIDDYSHIFWSDPFSDGLRLLYDSCGLPPSSSCPNWSIDNRHVWGGQPSWLDKVINGSWSGRLVVLTHAVVRVAQGTTSTSNHASSEFLNQYDTGITCNTIFRIIARDDEGEEVDVPATISDIDLTKDVGSLLTSAQAASYEFTGGVGTSEITESFAIIDQEWGDWCDWANNGFTNGDIDDIEVNDSETTCGLRRTFAKESGVVDLVFIDPDFVCPNTWTGNTDYDADRRKFVENLLTVRLKSRAELAGQS